MNQYDEKFGQGGLNDQVSVSELINQLGLDEEEIQWRKDFVGFTEEDAERLAALEDQFENRAETMADQFYDHIFRYDQTREVVSRSSKTVDQLKETQRAYLNSLATGEYNKEYFANRARIGKLHELLDMPIKQYLGQYNVYYELAYSVIGDRIRDRLADSLDNHSEIDTDGVNTAALIDELMSDVEAGLDEHHSLLKLLNLDMQVAIATYIQSYLNDLRIERDRFAALFENVPTPVVAVRVDQGAQEVEQVNPAFENLFGLTVEDLQGDHFEQALRPPGVEPEPIDDWTLIDPHGVTSKRELTKAEVTLETQFGQRQFIRVSAPATQPGLEQIEYAFYLDVTDQKQRQERLQVLSRVLRHDTRNQMQIICGYTSLLRETTSPEKKKQLVDEIEAASDELLSLTNKVRNIEQVISGRANRYPIDVTDTIKCVANRVRNQHPRCSFSLSMPEEEWISGTQAVRTAIENIIENAAEHNDADNPTVNISVVQSQTDDHIEICVEDNGPGIPESEYEILLGKRKRSQVSHTSGLGLWTVHWIVTQLGGSLQFKENTPRGTVVRMRLPRTSPPEKQ